MIFLQRIQINFNFKQFGLGRRAAFKLCSLCATHCQEAAAAVEGESDGLWRRGESLCFSGARGFRVQWEAVERVTWD